MTTELVFTEGMQFDKGYISPYFVTDQESMEAVFDEPYVLLTNQKIGSLAELLPLLEKVIQESRPLVIVAEDVEGEALSTLVVNAIRKTFPAVAVKAPFFGDRRKQFLEDLAIVSGGTVVSPEIGLKLDEVGLEVLGRFRRATVTKDDTTFVDGYGSENAINDRIRLIEREIEDTDSDWDREKLQERLAKLGNGVAVIKVGAATEVELKERKHRIEDAISATRAAVEEGVLPGGGSALVHAATRSTASSWTATSSPARRSSAGRWTSRCGRSPATPASRARSWSRGSASRRWARASTRTRRLRRPRRARDHRPGQGDQGGAGQRGLDRDDGADHGERGRGQAGRAAAGR